MLIDDLKLKLKKEYPGLWDDDQGITLDQIVDLVAREVAADIKKTANGGYRHQIISECDKYIINQCGDK